MMRKTRKEDVSRIVEILIFVKRIELRPIFQDDDFSSGELQMISVAKQYIDEGIIDNVLVYDDGIVKGFIRVEGNKIVELYVDYFFQNQSIGSALIGYTGAHYPITFLWAIEKNQDAIRFYEAYDFHLTDTKKFEEGTTEYLIMLTREGSQRYLLKVSFFNVTKGLTL